MAKSRKRSRKRNTSYSKIEKNIRDILINTLQFEDGTYITFIYTNDPRANRYNNIAKTMVITKRTKNGKPFLKYKGKNITIKQLITKFNVYIKNDEYSTMLSVESPYDENRYFYNIDKDNLYYS